MIICKESFNYVNIENEESEANIVIARFDDFDSLKKTIEDNIVMLAFGDETFDIEHAKKKIYSLFKDKDINHSIVIGGVAEFFAHILLKELGFNRYSIFSNLEEKALKRGFDGFVEKNNDFWIVESKSSATISETHISKIKEAIEDMTYKVSPDNSANPWDNALHHMQILRLNVNGDIYQKVKQLDEDKLDCVPHDISEFNIIPASTLFFDSNMSKQDLKEEIKAYLSGKKYKDILVLAIDNCIKDVFLKYLRE